MNNAEAIYKMLVPTAAPEPAKTPGQVAFEAFWKAHDDGTFNWPLCPVDAWEAAAGAVLAIPRENPKPLPTEDDVRAAGCSLQRRGDLGRWYIVHGQGVAIARWLRSDGMWTFDPGDTTTKFPTREAALEAFGRRRS